MNDKDSAVIYVDGGYMHKAGNGGWGLHGFTYNGAPPKRGSGNPKALPTAKGYSDSKDNLVSVTNYIDGAGPIESARSSTEVELVAAIKALEWISENDIKHTVIKSDSKTVVDGASNWINKWKNNGWVKSDGKTVSSKNHWQTVDDLQTLIKSQQKTLEFEWVKGHNGEFGNETVDQYARIGNSLSMRGGTYSYLTTKASLGYWNPKVSFNRLLGTGKWYFSTTDEQYQRDNGEYIYYVGDHGKEDELYGKPITSTSLTVLFLKQAEPVLETYRKLAVDLDVKKFGAIMIGRLDNIFNKFQYTQIIEHGSSLLHWDNKRKDITTGCHQKKMLIMEQNPPKLAYQAVETIHSLEKRLIEHLDEEGFIMTSDVTDVFYETDKKGKTKLKKEIPLTIKTIELKAVYNTDKKNTAKKTENKTKDIKMIVGRDLPGRNTLNHLADTNPKIEVITWRESSKAIRYATVVTTDEGVGIWAGVYSNFLLV